MRIVSVAHDDIAAVAGMLVSKLTELLSELCKGFQHGQAPKTPAFHHYIFESLAAVIRHTAAIPTAVASMEEIILPPFQVRAPDAARSGAGQGAPLQRDNWAVVLLKVARKRAVYKLQGITHRMSRDSSE